MARLYANDDFYAFNPDFAGQAARIHAAITALPLLAGQLIRVNRPPR
jgi:hypothetical protein